MVRSIEKLEDKREILATIGSIINKYETRIKPSYVFGCIDDHNKSEEMYNFLRNIGFDRI